MRALALCLAAVFTATGCEGERAAGPSSDATKPVRSAPAAGVDRLAEGVTFRQFTRRLADGSPVQVSLLTVASDADAVVQGDYGRTLPEPGTVRQLASHARALAAVNASFFDTQDNPQFGGIEGDPLGLFVADGAVLSEAANGRTALILGERGTPARIAELRSSSILRGSNGAQRELDGVNRVPGRILGCGGVGGDTTTAPRQIGRAPHHNQLCTDPGEIVEFRRAWGSRTPSGPRGSTEAVLDGTGRVAELRTPAGGPLASGQTALSGIGSGARWLREHARPGALIGVDHRITDQHGQQVAYGPGVTVVGAGPAIVRNGKTWINLEANGVSDAVLRERDPRTVAGIRADGTLLLAVFDGRSPGSSVGVTLPEAAETMESLGAVDAMGLDGGGSSTAVVRNKVRNVPRDTQGGGQVERAVSTALVVREE